MRREWKCGNPLKPTKHAFIPNCPALNAVHYDCCKNCTICVRVRKCLGQFQCLQLSRAWFCASGFGIAHVRNTLIGVFVGQCFFFRCVASAVVLCQCLNIARRETDLAADEAAVDVLSDAHVHEKLCRSPKLQSPSAH